MRRRSRASSKLAKARSRKAKTLKAVRHSSSASASGQETEVARLTRELKEAREHQAATADVLKIVSHSTFDLGVVLGTLVELAARLCEADIGLIRRREGDTYPVAVTFGVTPQQREHLESYPTKPDRGSAFGRAILKGHTVHIPDVLADPEFDRPQLQSIGRFRAVLAVPLMREGIPIGVLGLVRSEPRPFTNEQITLVRNFAAQAVIAIENTRLLNELRDRTDDLSEALEQQTATSEVLRVISSSPGELKPVFDAMLENAVRICEAQFGNLFLFDGHEARMAAMHNAPAAYEQLRRGEPVIPLDGTIIGPCIKTKKVNHVRDLSSEEPYARSALVKKAGARSGLAVPMLREDTVVGGITIYRQEVRPFTDKQIALVQNFAAQAVIAIENTRLLNELRESLQQQTATSEVLSVISSSPGELEPVFRAMLENATRICGANFGILHQYRNGAFHVAAMVGVPLILAKALVDRGAYIPPAGIPLDRLLKTRSTVHILDQTQEKVQPPSAILAGARSHLSVPMIREGEIVGAFTIYRTEVRPFTDKQIALVQNFAAQAVIAIENARLLDELRQSLEQQTATSEVLRVISASPGELKPVFETMLENATRICGAKFGILNLFDGYLFHVEAEIGVTPELAKFHSDRVPYLPDPATPLGRLLSTKEVIHTADQSLITNPSPSARLGGARSL